MQDVDLKVWKMPNGRSGGFIIERTDLAKLVTTFPGETVVAKIHTGGSAFRPIDALEAARLVEECENARIAVEEQDYMAYVIHLANHPKILWLVVNAKDPIFLELRRRHFHWRTQHPDWMEWMAF